MSDSAITVTKASHWVQVNVRDGVPYCPCHDEPMTQIGDDEWRCELGLALEQRLRELMADDPKEPTMADPDDGPTHGLVSMGMPPPIPADQRHDFDPDQDIVPLDYDG